jgi:hypothetical protein
MQPQNGLTRPHPYKPLNATPGLQTIKGEFIASPEAMMVIPAPQEVNQIHSDKPRHHQLTFQMDKCKNSARSAFIYFRNAW